MNRKEKGNRGERMALEFLIERGYDVIAKNFRTRFGEIDIIAGNVDYIVFVEVKVLDSYGREELEYIIGPGKKRRIRETAIYFLTEKPSYREKKARFDIIVLLNNFTDIIHIEDAF